MWKYISTLSYTHRYTYTHRKRAHKEPKENVARELPPNPNLDPDKLSKKLTRFVEVSAWISYSFFKEGKIWFD